MLKMMVASGFFASNIAPLLTPAPMAATLPYLKSGMLQTLDEEKRKFQADELWADNGAVIYAVRRAGCPLCRAAAQDLSALQPEMYTRGVKMYALVHEEEHVEGFKTFFKGDVFLDVDKWFYGPVQRRQHYISFFSVMSCYFAYKNMLRKIPGEKGGEGRLLGATFVIGPGDQGILFQHNEHIAGNEADMERVKGAINETEMRF